MVTIGTFDGVHLGHRKILERLTNNAKNTGLKSAVLTFFPHPRMVLQKDLDIKLLNTLEEKKQILETLGLDYFVPISCGDQGAHHQKYRWLPPFGVERP